MRDGTPPDLQDEIHPAAGGEHGGRACPETSVKPVRTRPVRHRGRRRDGHLRDHGIAAANFAGPALIVSFVISGIVCLFAALCYAEFAAMVPVAGSAYTYSYASLGEIWARIIG
ncbi:amino acid permease [Methanoculleus sp.]|uniref:amino acid permease n=1 Tax=Methanoculleus sp. TaxID=90427 RepID=UPI002FC66486